MCYNREMETSILALPEQFKWVPEIVNGGELKKSSKFIVCGMGGSHLAAGLLKVATPKLDLLIHRDYDLPRVPDYFLKESLIICCSYSGNTVETIDAFKTAHEAGLQVAAISTGGVLLELAQAAGVPLIRLPATGIQPRMALGYFVLALAKLTWPDMGASLKSELNNLSPERWRAAGEKLAEKLKGKIPLIYTSTINLPLASTWKIKLNETGKSPAFYNVFPELNHNELEGFEFGSGSKFAVIMLHDEADDHRILERMDITADLLNDKGLTVEVLGLEGETKWEKIFNSLLLADWTAFYLARTNNVDPESVALIEQFKKLMV